MAAQPRLTLVGAGSADTTYTKIFVGGLAWETQRETMRHYFENFGEILEAVVITDKNTGRSKGYGFVTFKEYESAFRALQDPTPVIDGRRANCNLAAFGAAQRPMPITPELGMMRFRPAIGSSIQSYPGSTAIGSYMQQPSQYQYPNYYNYGYSGAYSQENMYPMNYYGALYGAGSGGQQQQYPTYYAATAPGVYPNINAAYAAYAATAQNNQGQSSYGVQYGSAQMLQYPNYVSQQQFGSTSPVPTSTTGVIGGSGTAGMGSSSAHLNTDKRN